MTLRASWLVLFALALACGGVTRPEGPTRYVLANKPLRLRAEPNRNAAELAEVPYGSEVVLLPDEGPLETVSGMREPWQHVWFDGQTGWAFGGYLGPWRPPAECPDLGTTVRTLWGVEGEPTLLLQKGDPENRFEQWSANLVGGARLEWVDDPDGGTDALVVPGVSLNQAWNTLRRCVPEPEEARGWSTPTVSRTCGDGCAVVVTPTTIRVDHAPGRGCSTHLERLDDGVRISIACGLDTLAPPTPSR